MLTGAYGQRIASDSLSVIRLNIDKGLSNNAVRCIFQDHHGFMWFGTYDGLNRYDGYDFKIFRNVLEDSNSLPHNFIYAINEDSCHQMWIGTGQGIGIYSAHTGSFRLASYKAPDNERKLRIANHVNSIAVDKSGTVYIGTNGAGLMVAPKGKDVASQFNFQRDGNWTADYNITAIKVDKYDQVWMFISRIGLCLFDKKRRQIQMISRQSFDASALETDEWGNVWLGTASGIYRYNRQNGALTLLYSSQNGSLPSNDITSLCIGADGKIWAGLLDAGAAIIDSKSKVVKHLPPGDGPYDISGAVIATIYEDREKRKWLGTTNSGIEMYHTSQSYFRTVSHEQFNKSSLPVNFASCFMEARDGHIWIGTDGGGLSIWNRNAGKFSNYKYVPGISGALSDNRISSIVQDHLGDVWVATFGGGINKWNKQKRTFTTYSCKNTLSGINNDRVWIMFEDSRQVLWATTFGSGFLYYLNREKDRFEVFSQELIDLLSVFQDSRGVLWAGTAHELIKIDPADKNHIRYEMGKPVRAIHEDKLGNFWIGSEGGGLILFDRHAGRLVKRFTVRDGLSNNGVLTILEDNKANLWMSTFNGLSQFNISNNKFKNYFQDDGLQSNQFLYGAALKLNTGEMLFGGVHGFNIFDPARIIPVSTEPVVLMTGLRINNLPLSRSGHYIKDVAEGSVKAIEMPFGEATFSVDFAALEYARPNRIAYASFLEGWDRNWNYNGKIRTITYTNLHEGSYLLHVKATDAEGGWSGKELILQVKVLPPWFRSWWAYACYAAAFACGVILYQRFRISQAKLKYEVALSKALVSQEKAEREKAEAEYKTQIAETAVERIKMEKEQEINDKRLTFFTNITHEFRTPINLIVNPVKELLQDPGMKKKDLSALKLVYRNARRLLSLIDQLLLFRKAEAGADRVRIVKLDLNCLCKEVFLAFEHQAKIAHINYEFKSVPGPVEIYSDREKLEIVFFNLLSNAFKYTPGGGSITLEVTEQPAMTTICVKDTGHGIPADVGDTLFDRFYQVKHHTISKPGFGIGLFLVKHFIESLKGNIRYESQEGKGTAFYIELSKDCLFNEHELVAENKCIEPGILHELVEEPDEPQPPIREKSKLSDLDALLNEKRSMLIVDDDQDTINYLSRFFGTAFLMYAAGNAADGLKLAGKHVPDIIISDVNMEGMSGIDFCISIKEDPSLSHIPVILLTGDGAAQTKMEGLEGGADDYITKPFDKDLLMARVQNILKSRTTLQKYFYNEITFGKTTYKVAPEYRQFLDNCIKIVEENMDNPDFGIKTLTAELHMGHSNLYKKIKSICGQPPNAFIRFIRLRKAAKLLMETNRNISEAAMESGFSDMKYFREQFTKLFGLRPSEFVKTYRKGLGKNDYEASPEN